MNPELARHCIEKIHAEFAPKKMGKEGLEKIRDELLTLPDQAMMAAYDYFILNSRFPSPQQLLDSVKTEAQKIKAAESKAREKEWEEKKEKRSEGGSLHKSISSEIARLSIMAITGLSSGKISPEDYVEFHRHMGSQYGDEWYLAGAEIEKDFIRRGIIQDKRQAA